MLIAKHGKPFTEGTFIKDCVMKIVENISPEKKQEFAHVCLARNTVARRIEDISSDIQRQLGDMSTEIQISVSPFSLVSVSYPFLGQSESLSVLKGNICH